MSISRKQIQLIHIAKAELGLSDEAYRALLLQRYPNCFSGSCKELTYAEASDLLDYFKARGFTVRKNRKAMRRPKRPPAITDMITPGQRAKIAALVDDINWRRPVKGPRGFCKRMLGVEYPRTMEEASTLIEALKGMRDNQQRENRVTVACDKMEESHD